MSTGFPPPNWTAVASRSTCGVAVPTSYGSGSHPKPIHSRVNGRPSPRDNGQARPGLSSIMSAPPRARIVDDPKPITVASGRRISWGRATRVGQHRPDDGDVECQDDEPTHGVVGRPPELAIIDRPTMKWRSGASSSALVGEGANDGHDPD